MRAFLSTFWFIQAEMNFNVLLMKSLRTRWSFRCWSPLCASKANQHLRRRPFRYVQVLSLFLVVYPSCYDFLFPLRSPSFLPLNGLTDSHSAVKLSTLVFLWRPHTFFSWWATILDVSIRLYRLAKRGIVLWNVSYESVYHSLRR